MAPGVRFQVPGNCQKPRQKTFCPRSPGSPATVLLFSPSHTCTHSQPPSNVQMPPKKTKTPNPSGENPTTPTQSQPKPKKQPILWEKDGKDGNSSMCILLDLLATEGNYQQWRRNNKGGLSNTTLANEILNEMEKAGITHWDNKGIQTRIQDLQKQYGKACKYARATGAELLEEDLANGTTTLHDVLNQQCRFYDKLHSIMGTQTCADPQAIRESTVWSHPDLLGESTTNESGDTPAPNDSLNANRPSLTNNPSYTPAPSDPAVVNQTVSTDLSSQANEEADSSATVTPNPRGAHGLKRKRPSKGSEPQGLEKVLADSYEFKMKCFEAREQREDKRDKAQARREKLQASRDKMQAKLQAKRDKKNRKIQAKKDRKDRKIERNRLRLAKVDSQLKIREAKTAKVGKRLAYMRELLAMGCSEEDVDKFLNAQFSQGEKSNQIISDSSSSDSLEDETEDKTKDEGEEKDEDSTHK
ncbi:hypothetical protein PCASD_17900 [Puccinia coronata f. sp. avenae]|uniref:Uncharacterized protein n=1 Tax=Puccinia coronata f. sp. avenae TaxID=200324 RepID=A0A2N5U947_9BASI|nr:hypothetical protein PCASD_17900 [Puccinia coronata f. sp. avenae]